MNSLGKNAFYNILKQLCSVIFPLITLPYVSRILQAENYGNYSFSSSFVSYISFIACLGISTYAVREGARVRNNKDEVNKFVNEVFTINVISTVIAILTMFIIVNYVKEIREYKYVIYILAINIIFTTIGTDWVNIVYEDYSYIAVRYVLTHILSLFLLFLFVRSRNDILWYALVSISGNVCANIINFFHVRKKYDLHSKIVRRSLKTKHIVPIFVLFSSGIALNIYINSDVTVLGIIKGDYAVGIYTVATRIYFMVKTMINSVTTVVIPRASSMLESEDNSEVSLLYKQTLSAVVLLSIPALIGLISMSDEIILLLSGGEYLNAAVPLRILSIALIFATLGSVFVNCILTPHRMEKTVLKFTLVSAVVNIILNIILIPRFGYNAAALTTVIAEAIMCLCSYYYSRKIYILNINNEIKIALVGSFFIFIICSLGRILIEWYVLRLCICITISILLYIFYLIIVKNNFFYEWIMNRRRQ